MIFKSGDLVEDYPYLWLRQRKAGETEGRKPRPVCVALAVKDSEGRTHLALLPISSQPPLQKQDAIAIPIAEARRLKLESAKQAWVYVSEYNYDLAELSFYLKPRARPDVSLSPKFLKQVLTAFKATLVRKAGRVSRQE